MLWRALRGTAFGIALALGVALGAAVSAEPEAGADATVKVTHEFFLRLLLQQVGLREAVFSDELDVDGSRRRRARNSDRLWRRGRIDVKLAGAALDSQNRRGADRLGGRARRSGVVDRAAVDCDDAVADAQAARKER